MVRVELHAPDTADVHYIARHLRAPDVAELQAVYGDDVDLVRCLRTAVLSSDEVHTAFTAFGEPMALFGVAPVSLLGGQGCPWMLGTDTMRSYGRDIVSLSREHVARWGERYDQLFNFVDARNLRSIEWLKRTGFAIFEPVPFGVKGLPFHRFERCT